MVAEKKPRKRQKAAKAESGKQSGMIENARRVRREKSRRAIQVDLDVTDEQGVPIRTDHMEVILTYKHTVSEKFLLEKEITSEEFIEEELLPFIEKHFAAVVDGRGTLLAPDSDVFAFNVSRGGGASSIPPSSASLPSHPPRKEQSDPPQKEKKQERVKGLPGGVTHSVVKESESLE